MKRLSAVLSVILALILLLSASVFSANGKDEFSDMPSKTNWAYNALVAAVENGLLKGDNGRLNPKNNLTRAEMATVINRAFGAVEKSTVSFTDVKKTAWFADEIAKSVKMGTFKGDGDTMRPGDPITRQEAFSVLARAFRLEAGEKSDLDRFTDKKDIASWAVPEISAMAKAGYINGDGGKLNPKNTISRAEFAQVMFNLIKAYFNESREYSVQTEGNAMVNTAGVTLKNMTVKGDLIVGEGAAEGDVILDNTTIEGRLVVRGGGKNSVIIKNSSSVGSLLISKTGDSGVRVRTEEGCRIEVVEVDDGNDEIILSGTFNQVNINTDTPVILDKADITGLTVKAENSDVETKDNTKIKSALIKEEAKNTSLKVNESSHIDKIDVSGDNVSVSGKGKVDTVLANADNATIDVKEAWLIVDEEAKGVKENGNDVKSGDEVQTGVHRHEWKLVSEGKMPTCTEPGTGDFRCDECGAEKKGSIEALGHNFGRLETVKEATVTEDGIVSCTCSRCSLKVEEPVSFMPYSIELRENEDDEIGVTLGFRTLEEAMAEAEKHRGGEEDGDEPFYEYINISLGGSDVIKDLYLPEGYTLLVTGGHLTVLGSLNIEPSDYPTCPGKGAGRLFVLPWGEVNIDGEEIFGRNGKIRTTFDYFAEDAGNSGMLETICITGLRNEEGETYGKPWVYLGSFFGEAEFTLKEDYDFSGHFDGLAVEETANLDLNAKLQIPDLRVYGGRIALYGENTSLGSNGIEWMGFTDNCIFRMNAADGGFMDITDGNFAAFIGGDVDIDTTSLDAEEAVYFPLALGFFPTDEKPGELFTMTVKAGSQVALYDSILIGNVTVEKGAFLQNAENHWLGITEGTLTNKGEMLIIEGIMQVTDADVVNDGMIFTVYGNIFFSREEKEDLSFVNNGTLNVSQAFNLDCGTFANNGKLVLLASEYTHGDFNIASGTSFMNSGNIDIRFYEDDDCFEAANLNINGGSFFNEEGGLITNRGSLNGNIPVSVIEICGEEKSVREEKASAFKFTNKGNILNYSEINLSGVFFENSGIIYNKDSSAHFRVADTDFGTETRYIEETEYNDEILGELVGKYGWDNVWEDNGTIYYVTRREYNVTSLVPSYAVNRGKIINDPETNLEITNSNFINYGEGVLTNDGRISFWHESIEDKMSWFADRDESEGRPEEILTIEDGINVLYPMFINFGTLANGSVTDVGERDNGSDARFEFSDGDFTNGETGSIVNNGQMNIEYSIVFNFGSFVTYNAAGLEFSGCDVNLESPLFNEGYMRVADVFYGGKDDTRNRIMKSLDGIKSETRDDSHWIDYTAAAYTYEGFVYASQINDASADKETGERKYNRLDIDFDLTVGEKDSLTLSSFDSYWLQPYFDREEGMNHNPTITVNGDLYLKDTNLNIFGYRDFDGENYTDNIVSMVINKGGRFYIPNFSIDISDFENFEGDELSCFSNIDLWDCSSFINNGEVFDDGGFYVWYSETEGENGTEFVHIGTLSGLPESARNIADIRSFEGMKIASADAESWTGGIRIRDNTCIDVNESITLPAALGQTDVEPGSGIIIEHGAVLTAECHIHNSGDISIYGDLIARGGIRNEQNMGIGAVTGNEEGRLITNELDGWGNISQYKTGIISLSDTACTEHVCIETESHITIKDDVIIGINPESGWSNVYFRNISFDGKVEIDAGNNKNAEIYFENCSFSSPVVIKNCWCEENDGTTWISVNGNGLSAHIFNGSSIFIPLNLGEDEVTYTVKQDGIVLTGYSREIISEMMEDDVVYEKTHLSPTEDGSWFTSQNNTNIELSAKFADGTEVILMPVPVKYINGVPDGPDNPGESGNDAEPDWNN